MAYDLVIQTQKGIQVPSADYVRSVNEQLRSALDATSAWFELIAHQLRGAQAKSFLENDGLLDADYRRAFENFCLQEHINREPLTENVALRFVVYDNGAHLATVALPSDHNSCAAVFRALVAFAQGHGLRIVDPQAGAGIDLACPGQYPPRWTGAR